MNEPIMGVMWKIILEDESVKEARFLMYESNAFAYGNQTCVQFDIDSEDIEFIDTRYEKFGRNNYSSFKKWTKEYLKQYLRKTIKIGTGVRCA